MAIDGGKHSNSQLTLGSSFLLASAFIPLAFSKWGSGLGRNPLFVSDILAFIGAMLILFSPNKINHFSHGSLYRFQSWNKKVVLSGLFLALYVGIQMLYRDFSFTLEIRDSAPLIYALLLPFLVRAVMEIDYRRLQKFLEIALISHTVWIAGIRIGAIEPIPVSLASYPIFAGRGDFDAGICAITSVFFLFKIMKTKFRVSAFGLAVLNSIIVVQSGNRAAFLCFVFLIIFLLKQIRNESFDSQTILRKSLVIWVFILLTIVIETFSAFSSWERTTSILTGSNVGTVQGRLYAWLSIAQYLASSPTLILFGLGPGSEAMILSGASLELNVGEDVRSPHNIALFLLLRFGLIGLALWSLFLFQCFKRQAHNHKPDPNSSLIVFFAKSVIICMIILGLFGVIIETPFGAYCLYFGSAILIASRIKSVSFAPKQTRLTSKVQF